MRVLHITPYYYPALRYGGPIASIHGLCRNLVSLGHDIQVFTTDRDGPSTVGRPLGVPVDVNGVKVWYFRSTYGKRLFFSPAMRRELARRARGFDLLHIHTFFSWPVQIAASTARKNNIPYILEPHGMLDNKLIRLKSRRVKRAWINIFGRRVVENAAGIRAITDSEIEEIRRFRFKLPPVFALPVGIDVEDAHPEPAGRVSPLVQSLTRRKPFLLFLSRINWKKGLDRLIPALVHVPGAHLVVAGYDENNYCAELEKLAQRYQVADRVVIIGPVDAEDKRRLFEQAAVFVLPSYSENFGIAVLEAMAVGVPVVVTPEVGLAREVENVGAGVVVLGDPGTLGPGIRALLADPLRLREMGERGRALVGQRFAWSRIAKEMEKVYREIIS